MMKIYKNFRTTIATLNNTEVQFCETRLLVIVIASDRVGPDARSREFVIILCIMACLPFGVDEKRTIIEVKLSNNGRSRGKTAAQEWIASESVRLAY